MSSTSHIRYAELQVTTNFSFLRGGSHPEELVSAAMHLAVIYVPALSRLFETVPLSTADWALVLFLSGWSQALESLLAKARRVVLRRISMVRV